LGGGEKSSGYSAESNCRTSAGADDNGKASQACRHAVDSWSDVIPVGALYVPVDHEVGRREAVGIDLLNQAAGKVNHDALRQRRGSHPPHVVETAGGLFFLRVFMLMLRMSVENRRS
jgi:hypothetical protein